MWLGFPYWCTCRKSRHRKWGLLPAPSGATSKTVTESFMFESSVPSWASWVTKSCSAKWALIQQAVFPILIVFLSIICDKSNSFLILESQLLQCILEISYTCFSLGPILNSSLQALVINWYISNYECQTSC